MPNSLRARQRINVSHYRISRLCQVPAALGKALIALGKGFAECRPRQTPHGNQRLGKAEFAECFLSDT